MVTQYEIGDFVRLRKRHPCGEFDWRVVRVGADIGIVCVGCQRRVTMARSALERRIERAAVQGNATAIGRRDNFLCMR